VGFVYALKTERSFGFTPRFSASRALWCVCVCVCVCGTYLIILRFCYLPPHFYSMVYDHTCMMVFGVQW
jgi:hypothetical protein